MQKTPNTLSKWIDLEALLDPVELHTLLDALQSPLYLIGEACEMGRETVSIPEFVERYKNALQGKRLSSVALSLDPSVFSTAPIGEHNHVLRLKKPAVHMQPLKIAYSRLEEKFRTRTFGPDAKIWGLQISYPTLCSDENNQPLVVRKEPFCNNALFSTIQKWIREHTLPTTFCVEGKTIRSPIRIGKKALSWVNDFTSAKELSVEILT